ncbi:MAG TPA: sigma 54-interacting transcriptional regulator [Syntrophomonadaceae bacterium]|nr:sigma 54-interacting transcriptional regulator [Syntrophomonadaceae bacterium]HQE22267.1 sigma 54-interacting transcriptional regulator [Syntrophomonadaceae bacterium]
MTDLEDIVRKKERIIDQLITIANLVSDGILVTKADSTIIMINQKHALLDMFTMEEVVGQKLTNIVEGGFYTFLSPVDVYRMAEILEEKKTLNFEAIVKSGRRLLVSANPILNEDGKVYRIVYTSRDITALEKMRRELEKEANLRMFYEQQLRHDAGEDLIFRSKEMHDVLDIVMKVSKVDSNIFLNGESGVGKGVIARKIHELGPRKDQPFVQLNCAAIPENLFEAELFGYDEGAFTGAKKQGKPGLLELAGDGTIFLDEIADLPSSLQAKLLQVLQEGEFRRVGGVTPIRLKARVITATNKDLEELVRQNRFREDLYYRLCVVPITIPPLKHRPEDILLLANYFLQKFNNKYGLHKRLDDEVKKWMCRYPWPGNVRELQNIIERLAIVSEGDFITLLDIPDSYRSKSEGLEDGENFKTPSLKEVNEAAERRLLESVIRNSKSSRQAAKELGISQATLLRKAHKYGIALGSQKD